MQEADNQEGERGRLARSSPWLSALSTQRPTRRLETSKRSGESLSQKAQKVRLLNEHLDAVTAVIFNIEDVPYLSPV